MKSTRKLSSREVAALFSGLEDADSGSAQFSASGAKVRPYKLGENDLGIMGEFHGLRMINERFCRLARTVFLPMLRIQPRISAFPPTFKSFESYADELENFVSLTTSSVEALRGTSLLVMTPGFVSMLTESYYGGTIRNLSHQRKEFTATELRVIRIVCEGLNAALSSAWEELLPAKFEIQAHEDNLQFAGFVDSSEMVVVCSFLVQIPGASPAELDILYPLQTLKPLGARLRARTQTDRVQSDRTWRERLEQAVLGVPLTLSAQLAEPEVTLRALKCAGAGDCLPVALAPRPILLVEGRPIFRVDIGRSGTQSAVHVTRPITGLHRLGERKCHDRRAFGILP
ncbi:flagellar motor switch protein FliM [Rhodovulum bhavnagarense]|uniref:Flagellar motor switch protein FliM n=1 Tax=Rhodovulum bhavnagarense TaxID=992286 RepID=A0A4R2RQC2_9RHOB|nr:flagellar motor switch protein FliM [Rhodovulum bhavnagarense]TCP61385.1 flagellar motor switch protein FliM [Rhodovulum bhavnagarense]